MLTHHHCQLIDGAAFEQAVVPKGSAKFWYYCRNEFTAYLFNKCCQSNLSRVDIVFDIYLDHSITNSTRNKRGFHKQIKAARDHLSQGTRNLSSVSTNIRRNSLNS